MKRIAFSIIALLVSLASATAQTQVMTVHQKDGTVQNFPLDQIEEVTFDKSELPQLQNQFASDDVVTSIGSVLMTQDGTDYGFALYEAKGVTEISAGNALLVISLPADQLGKSIDLATADPDDVFVGQGDSQADLQSGTLKVSFDKFNKNVTISLESQTTTGHYLRAAYAGSFVRTYTADNELYVTPQGGEPANYGIASVLRVKPASTGDATQIAFGDAQATTAGGLQQSHCAVWFGVAASKLNSTIDLAADKSSYTFKYIDYATGSTLENTVAEGTLTTAQADGDKVYFTLSARLEDGTLVEADYYGTVTDVESLDAMVPTPVMPNKFLYYNADGAAQYDKPIVTVKYKDTTTSDGIAVRTLYFAPENADVSDKWSSPQLQFTEKFVNAGKVDLSQLQEGDGFKIVFGSLQLTSPDAMYHGWSAVPDNGLLTLTQDADGNYDIYIEIVNKYKMGTTSGGDGNKLVLSYKGKAEAM